MNRIFLNLALSAALTALAAVPAANAQTTALPRNDRILIDYQDPFDPEEIYGVNPTDKDARTKLIVDEFKAFTIIKQRLQERKVLERFAQFLVPLKLPTTLRVVALQCDSVNAYFSPKEISINICYDYINDLEVNAPKEPTDDGITRDDAVIGGLVSVLLHETGHALFHLYRTPLLGRGEDAADQIGAYVMLQFGDDVALRTIKGALWTWSKPSVPMSSKASTAEVSKSVFSDVHSTAQQRFTTYLCIAYGGKPALFKPFIDAGYLHPSRAATCRRDYEQIERAFIKTILPHIDQAMMAKVQSATWFDPQDTRTIPVQTR